MVYLLIGIAIVEFLYILYQDFANRKERQKLSLLLKSENAVEFQTVTEAKEAKPQKEEKPVEEEGETHVPIENILDEIPLEKLVGAKDKL